MTITAQDQQAFIAINALAGTPLYKVQALLKNTLHRQAYSHRYIAELYEDFRTGRRTYTGRCPVEGGPRTATDEDKQDALMELKKESRSWTEDQLANELDISQASVSRMLTELGFRKLGSDWVPHDLTCDQRNERVRVCRINLREFRRNARILGSIVAIDESWLQSYLPAHPQDAREWRLSDEQR